MCFLLLGKVLQRRSFGDDRHQVNAVWRGFRMKIKNKAEGRPRFTGLQIEFLVLGCMINLFSLGLLFFEGENGAAPTATVYGLWGGGASLYFILAILSFFPSRWNMLPAQNGQSKEYVVMATRTLICFLALVESAIFSYMVLQLTKGRPFSWLFFGILLTSLVFSFVIYFKKTMK